MKRLLLLLLALAFVAFGAAKLLVVTPMGSQTHAFVTGWEPVVDSNTEKVDHIYEVKYRFTDENGNQHSGSFRKKAYNITKLPSRGEVISVRYLRWIPAIHGLEGKNLLQSAFSVGVGLLLFFIAVKLKPKIHPPLG